MTDTAPKTIKLELNKPSPNIVDKEAKTPDTPVSQEEHDEAVKQMKAAGFEILPNEGDQSQGPHGPGCHCDEGPLDHEFPYGRPEQLDYTTVDIAGHDLLKALNTTDWIKTVEYCSGHPLDRPLTEGTHKGPFHINDDGSPIRLDPYREFSEIDAQFMKGLCDRRRRDELRQNMEEMSRVTFFLHVNVYNSDKFFKWVKVTQSGLLQAFGMDAYVVFPFRVMYQALRIQNSYNLTIDYFSVRDRAMIHLIMIEALKMV